MKRTIIAAFILAALTSQSQINYGVKSGISASYFNGFTMHQSPGFVGGVYAKQGIYKKTNEPALKLKAIHAHLNKLYPGNIGFSGSINDSTISVYRIILVEKGLIIGKKMIVQEKVNISKVKAVRKTRFSIQEELSYLAKGGYNHSEQTNFKTHYVQANVLAGVRVGFLTLQAGGYAARLVRTENYTWFGPSNDWRHKDWIYHFMDYGAVAGLEIDFHGVILSTQYQHGLRNVINKGSKWHSMNGFKNRTIAIQLQIPFKLTN